MFIDNEPKNKNEELKITFLTIPNSIWMEITFKGNTKFWYGVMNLVQMNILEAYTILQYSVIVVAVEIDSKVMKL